jgi:hypothetical protein
MCWTALIAHVPDCPSRVLRPLPRQTRRRQPCNPSARARCAHVRPGGGRGAGLTGARRARAGLVAAHDELCTCAANLLQKCRQAEKVNAGLRGECVRLRAGQQARPPRLPDKRRLGSDHRGRHVLVGSRATARKSQAAPARTHAQTWLRQAPTPPMSWRYPDVPVACRGARTCRSPWMKTRQAS